MTTAGGSASDSDFVNAVDIQRSICSQQLQATHSIRSLYVDNNDFNGEGIHILAAFMYVCPSVEYLYCRSCGITSNDLKQLLVLVSELRLSLPTLSSWDLSNNDIDDDGVSVLLQHLSVLPTLNDVTLDGNIRVSPGMLKTLEEKLDPRREVHLLGQRNIVSIVTRII